MSIVSNSEQLKLQQQNMRLAPPLLIPGKRMEDSGTTSEDDGLPRSPPEMSFQEVAMRRGASKVNETELEVWSDFFIVSEIIVFCVCFFCSSQYPEAKSQLSLLSLAGTGSEEEEQVMSR